MEATCNTEIEEKLVACRCVPEVWEEIKGWSLLSSDTGKALFVRQLETIQMLSGKDQSLFLTRVDRLRSQHEIPDDRDNIGKIREDNGDVWGYPEVGTIYGASGACMRCIRHYGSV